MQLLHARLGRLLLPQRLGRVRAVRVPLRVPQPRRRQRRVRGAQVPHGALQILRRVRRRAGRGALVVDALLRLLRLDQRGEARFRLANPVHGVLLRLQPRVGLLDVGGPRPQGLLFRSPGTEHDGP